MFRPSASSASSSALIPTWSWKSFVVRNGTINPNSAASPSFGHHPMRSESRWTSPRQPLAYSRRPARRATHSSTPISPPAGAGGSVGTVPDGSCGSTLNVPLHLLQRHLAEQSARPHQHHHNQDPEHDQ